MSGILIIGAGGHGKVVADILQCQGYSVKGFLDNTEELWGTTRLGLPVLGEIQRFADYEPDGMIVAVGSNKDRKRIAEQLDHTAQPLWINAIHPTATIADSVTLGTGVVVVAGAIINPDSFVGNHVIVNTAASIDHDCTIGDYAHIAPGVRLAGSIHVGQGTLVGINATVVPVVKVGAWTTVGAGAVVVDHIPDGVTAKGIPAHW